MIAFPGRAGPRIAAPWEFSRYRAADAASILRRMMSRHALASFLGGLLLVPTTASGQSADSSASAGIEAGAPLAAEPTSPPSPPEEGQPAAPLDSAAPQASDLPPAPAPERHRLFPLGGRAAIARGYRIPEPWGLAMLMVWNTTNFDSHDLSATVRKGGDPAPDAQLIDLPAVTTSKLEGDTRMLGLKGDLWLFPGVNLFAAVGEVKGTNKIDVDIDLDAVVPFPFCRPAKPCGSVRLPVETKVKNTTVTFGTLLVYGNEHWFVLGSVAKTVSVSSKQRSDVNSTNLGLRGGPRFRLGENAFFAPYFGANYFDLKTTVNGIVASGPLFEDGDGIHLRYRVDMAAKGPWAAVAGFNVELGRHLTLQAELQAGAESTRVLASTGIRF